MSDPADLYTVFVNVLRNAVEAGDGLGHARISVRQIDHGDAANQNASLIEFSFCDDGPGIPEDAIDRVFDPFYSNKHDHDGMGIGLALCKAILDQNGGSIRIDTSQGVYARVLVTIPKEA